MLAAHQPNYLPWLGFFHKLARADVWVVGDDVQFSKHGLTNRNRIRTREGWQWLTVPVLTKGLGEQQINRVRVDTSSNWRRKHLETLHWNYQGAPYFETYAAKIDEFFSSEWELLERLNLAICRFLLQEFGIDVEIRRSSELDLPTDRNLRLVEMAVRCDCDVYLAGTGGTRHYLETSVFEKAGVECRFNEFRHPQYKQCFPGFETNLAALDLLLNLGGKSKGVILAD